ncbi:hypothetical protein FOMG_17969 [Fusarium oxysporum f. sp. melonis 26406]|nr:hypothetical protein FOMG_17969 [Fusarium oxysporum f. sp. melonis 26406]KAJ9412786.1 acyltransferase 3 [Fusarium oxysporum]
MTSTSNILTLRLHDLDNLRTYLAGLVITGHTAIVYGSGGQWPIRSATVPPGTNPPLVAFSGFNQTFCMALFFWVSGRMSAQSMQRAVSPKGGNASGVAAFVRAKLWRLGIPTAVYSIAVYPIAHVLVLPHWDIGTIAGCLRAQWGALRGARGPVWYSATLLAFDIAAAGLTESCGGTLPSVSDGAYDALSRWGWLAVMGSSFVARTRWPIDAPDRLPLLDVRAGYLSQYLYAYALGWFSLGRGEVRMKSPWEEGSKSSGAGVSEEEEKEKKKAAAGRPARGPLSMSSAMALSLGTMLLAFAPVLVRVRPETLKKDLSQYMGGWNYQALLYTLWNELSLFIVGPALMALFQRRYSRPATSRTFSARYSYTAFLVHTPVNVAIELLVEAVLCPGGEKAAWMSTAAWKAAGPVIMTVLVSAVNVVASFTIGRWLVDYVPSVRSFI